MLAACGNPTEKAALARLDEAHKALQAAVQVGVTYVRFGELLQALAAEVLVAADKVTSEQGRERLTGYARAIEIYKDSMTLWRARLDSSA